MKLKIKNDTPDEKRVAFNKGKDESEALDIWSHGGFLMAAKYLTAHGWPSEAILDWKEGVMERIDMSNTPEHETD